MPTTKPASRARGRRASCPSDRPQPRITPEITTLTNAEKRIARFFIYKKLVGNQNRDQSRNDQPQQSTKKAAREQRPQAAPIAARKVAGNRWRPTPGVVWIQH